MIGYKKASTNLERSLLMGYSGGFKQGKPGKALPELTEICNSKITGGQFVSVKCFAFYFIEDDR